MTFPSDCDQTLVEVFHQQGDPPFVCGAEGCITGVDIAEIERELEDNPDVMGQGDGRYLYAATWVAPQVDDYGRVELPAYWDLALLAFEPLTLPVNPATL